MSVECRVFVYKLSGCGFDSSCSHLEIVHIDGVKGAQISIVLKKIEHKGDPRLWLWSPNKLLVTLIVYLLIICSYDVTDMIRGLCFNFNKECAQN